MIDVVVTYVVVVVFIVVLVAVVPTIDVRHETLPETFNIVHALAFLWIKKV